MGRALLNETKVTRALVKGMREHGAFVQRLEDMYSTGIPDITIVYKGIHVFIEMKHSNNEVVRSRKIGLRPAQVVWHHNCHKAGGNTLIVDISGKTMRVFQGKYSQELDASLKKDVLDSYAAYIGSTSHRHKSLLEIIELLFGEMGHRYDR